MKLIPQIRFKGFTDDWEERKLLDNVDKVLDYRGKSPTKFGMEWGTEGYLVLSALNVKNGYIDKSVEAKYGDQELFERWMGSNRLEKGDVLFTTEAPLGNVAQVPDDNGYILNQRAVAFKSSKDTDNNFFAQLLRSPIVQNTLNANSSGGTAKGIGMKEFAKLNAHVPKTFEEQQKIGTFFKQLDHTIALHQRKLDLLKEQKKGYLQKMFPKNGAKVPELRFAGFADDWEQRKLGEVGSVVMCKRIFKDQTTAFGDIPFYKIGTFGGNPDSFIPNELFEEYKKNYPYPEIGDILMSASGTIGRTIVYEGEKAYYQDSNIVWLKTDKSLIDNSFLKQFYQVVKWSGLEGSTIKRLYNSNILSTGINLPSLREQTKLGTFFNQIDNTIALHQEKIAHLKVLKSTLLNKMFI